MLLLLNKKFDLEGQIFQKEIEFSLYPGKLKQNFENDLMDFAALQEVLNYYPDLLLTKVNYVKYLEMLNYYYI